MIESLINEIKSYWLVSYWDAIRAVCVEGRLSRGEDFKSFAWVGRVFARHTLPPVRPNFTTNIPFNGT